MRGRTHLQQLLSPLRFWDVDYAGRTLYTRIVPAGVAVLAGALFAYFPKANVAHPRGLLDVSSGMLSMLVGFFVAALGLTLTIKSEKMDAVASANPPTLNEKPITWREFARAVTAYLVLMALCTYLVALATMVMHPAAARLDATTRMALRVGGGGIYAGLFTHVLMVTVMALFLMSDKLPELAKSKSEKIPASSPVSSDPRTPRTGHGTPSKVPDHQRRQDPDPS